jgi:hypothetical protein
LLLHDFICNLIEHQENVCPTVELLLDSMHD